MTIKTSWTRFRICSPASAASLLKLLAEAVHLVLGSWLVYGRAWACARGGGLIDFYANAAVLECVYLSCHWPPLH